MTESFRRIAIGVLLGLGLALVFPVGLAFAAEKAAADKPLAVAPALPTPNQMRMMIRTTLIALSQAGQTGNYTVLRDLGAPGFQKFNSAARLSDLFKGLREEKIDLSPVILIEPKLTAAPAINDRGHLRMTGLFASSPRQVNFDLAFEQVDGAWRVFGLAVSAAPARIAANSEDGKSAPKPAKDKGKAKPEKIAAAAPKAKPAQAAPQASVPAAGDLEAAAEAAEAPAQKNSGWNPFN